MVTDVSESSGANALHHGSLSSALCVVPSLYSGSSERLKIGGKAPPVQTQEDLGHLASWFLLP